MNTFQTSVRVRGLEYEGSREGYIRDHPDRVKANNVTLVWYLKFDLV